MRFKPYHVYHIFNQGNNKDLIFFEERNYHFFLEKMKKHLLPHAHLLAYCLMPNHFHWLVCVKQKGCQMSNMIKPSRLDHELTEENHHQQNLSAGIAVLLRSYTRAINIQQKRTGSLFRQKTKSENGDVDYPVALPRFSRALKSKELDLEASFLKADYWQTCFDYIHMNPVTAELVSNPINWEYSSAADYGYGSIFSLCNLTLSQEMKLVA